MQIVLFGASGFLGKELYKCLEKNLHTVIPYTSKNCDISNDTFMQKLKVQGDIIINCAAKTNNNSTNDYLKINRDGVQNIINFGRRQKFKKIIHCSTLSVIKRPWKNISETSINYVEKNNIYAYSKLMGEKAYINSHINHLILRLPALYGSNSNNDIIKRFINLAKNNEDIFVNENYYANFMFVEDVANFIVKILKTTETGILNIANSSTINMYQLAILIKKIYNSTSNIIKIPNKEYLEATVNINKMNKICQKSFLPITLQHGISKII